MTYGCIPSVILPVGWATDSNVKYPLLKQIRSMFGLKTLAERVRKGQKKMHPWSPSFAARFTAGSVLLINNETIKRA